MWKVIKENKDLDLPALMVMVATVRCEEISKEKLSSFRANMESLHKDVRQSHLEPISFGQKLSYLIPTCLSSYDKESHGFEDSVRSSKREQLEEKLLQLVQPDYKLIIKHIRSKTLKEFKKALSDALNGEQAFASAALDSTQTFKRLFDEQCEVAVIRIANWDLAKTRDNFSRDLDSHITELRTTKLSELSTAYESRLREALSSRVKDLLKGGNHGTWQAIRELLHDQETGTVVSEFSSALSSFQIYEEEENQMILELKNFARGFVEEKAREEASNVLLYMKERFASVMQQGRTDDQDIEARTLIAQSSSVYLLSAMAVIRLDRDIDTVEDTLVNAFFQLDNSSPDPLSSSEWEEVPLAHTLITPAECQSLWNSFLRETASTITQPNVSQAANAIINNRSPSIIRRSVTVIRDKAVQLASRVLASFGDVAIRMLAGFAAIALRGLASFAASQGWDFAANVLNLAATIVGGYEASRLIGYETVYEEV